MTLIDADRHSKQVIGCAIEVHKTLGPGLLEAIYEAALCLELRQTGLRFDRQPWFPVIYKGQSLDLTLRPNLIVEDSLVVEIKSVHTILPVHEAQLQTYMKLSAIPVGLLLNFNETVLKNGIRRRLL
jgi:GxxExxY protein